MSNKQFMIVEDDSLVAEYIQEQVQQWGYQISNIVSSGENALALLEGTTPDLVLMDIVLPGDLDGIDVAKVIQEKYRIPIIYLTAYSDREKITRASETLPYGYLVKPIDERELQIAIELTLHKAHTDKELTEQKRWAQAVLNSIEDGVVTTDHQGRIRFINPKAVSMLGCKSSAVLSRSVVDVIKFEKAEHSDLLARAATLSLGKSDFNNEFITGYILSIDAKKLPIEASISMIQSEDNKINGLVFTFRDITLQDNARQQLEKYNDELEQEVIKRTKELHDINSELRDAKNQLEAANDELKAHRDNLEKIVSERTSELKSANEELESFSYSVAHDLRAPLRSIAGFCHLLAEDASKKLSEQEQNYLNRTICAARLMAELIDDLLEFAKISREKINKNNVDLNSIVKEIISQYEENKHNRQVAWHVSDNLNAVGDPKMLKVVFSNLLDNAWKYTSKVSTAEIEVGIQNQNHEIIYYVKDNGVGFDMKYADKLFGVFQRLHANKDFNGTGIGLATVQRIIQRHGGRVWASAAVNKGATFYFTLNHNL